MRTAASSTPETDPAVGSPVVLEVVTSNTRPIEAVAAISAEMPLVGASAAGTVPVAATLAVTADVHSHQTADSSQDTVAVSDSTTAADDVTALEDMRREEGMDDDIITPNGKNEPKKHYKVGVTPSIVKLVALCDCISHLCMLYIKP